MTQISKGMCTWLSFLCFWAAIAGCESEAVNSEVGYGEATGRTVDKTLPGVIETLDYEIQTEVVADDLEDPWAIAFIGSDTALVTEQPGRLRLWANGQLHPEEIKGLPQVSYEGMQGGLLDVAVDPEYAQNGWIYISYGHGLSKKQSGRTLLMTKVVRGRIQNGVWRDQQVVFEAPHETYRTTRRQLGGRIVFDPEGFLYLSIGDRGSWPIYPHEVKMQSQDLARPNGKTHRLHRDGSIPEDNPFVGHDGAMESIFTYGNRNPQGLAIHPNTSQVWALEHGPRGGDELNILRAGANYGWPEITYGIDYDGSVITPVRRKEGMEQPVFYWRPSIATSGLSFYDGEDFPYWQGQVLVSSLKTQELRLLTIEAGRVMHQEVILEGIGRIREAVPGPDGKVYVVLNSPGRIVRLSRLADSTER